jgi:tetratricopeptide (TPR) repeat protein
VRLLFWAGLLWRPVNRLRALEFVERSAELYRRIGDEPKFGRAQVFVGNIQICLGRHEAARGALDRAVALLSASKHEKTLFAALFGFGNLAQLTNDPAGAERYYVAASNQAETLEDPFRESLVLISLAELDFRQGEIVLAVKRVERAIQGLREAGLAVPLGQALANLAAYLVIQGDYAKARSHAVEALDLLKEVGGYFLRAVLQLLALLGAIEGRYDPAALVYGHVAAACAASREPWQPLEQAINNLLTPILTANIPLAVLAGWFRESGSWTERRAVNHALKHLMPPEPDPL